MISKSVEFSENQVWAYNAISKYVVMGNALPNRVQRYNKICRCARKIAFSCDFLLGEILPSIRLPRETQGYSACTLSGKTITEIPEYDSGVMDKEKIEHSTTSRGNRRIFTRRVNAEHKTGGG